MTISEAVIKRKLKIGDVIENKHNRKLLRVKKIVKEDSSNFGVTCHYYDKQEQEELIKRGFTCVRMNCYEDYIPIYKKNKKG